MLASFLAKSDEMRRIEAPVIDAIEPESGRERIRLLATL